MFRRKGHSMKTFLKNCKWIILFICLILFLVIVENVFANEVTKMDVVGYELIANNFIRVSLTPIVKIFTNFGSALFLLPVTILLCLILKNRKIRFSILFNLIFITIINQVLKFIVQRPRPTDFKLIDESGYSFPSGHAMISVAFYGYLIFLIYKYIKNKIIKFLLISLLVILIIIIGISRIYLGVHYTSDVLAGFLISLSYLIMYISISNKWIEGR